MFVNTVWYIKYDQESISVYTVHSHTLESVTDNLKLSESTALCTHWKISFMLTSFKQMHYVPNYSLQWDVSHWPVWPLLDAPLRHKFKSCGCRYTNYSLKSQVDTELPRMPSLFPPEGLIKRLFLLYSFILLFVSPRLVAGSQHGTGK